MKVLNWLKKRNISYNINNTIITINGLRITLDEIKKGEFNSKKGYISYFNKVWRDIYQLINY